MKPSSTLHDLLLLIGGFFLGVSLMVTDELFGVATTSLDGRYLWPFLGYMDVWTSWGICFVAICLSVALLFVVRGTG